MQAISNSSLVKVATISDFGDRNILAVSVGSLRLALFLSDNGEVSALYDRCSHADVKLSKGKLDGDEIECTAHGARFDVRTGENRCMPAVTAVRSYPVRIEGDDILVELV